MRHQSWVMSEADTFDLLNAIDERLATHALDQRHRDVLLRLRAILEDDIAAISSAAGLHTAGDLSCTETQTAGVPSFSASTRSAS
jgi:hypothetical protein